MVISPTRCDFSLTAVACTWLREVSHYLSFTVLNPHIVVALIGMSACRLRATPSRLYRHLSGDRSDCPDQAVLHSHSIQLPIQHPVVHSIWELLTHSGVHPRCLGISWQFSSAGSTQRDKQETTLAPLCNLVSYRLMCRSLNCWRKQGCRD